jgi:hypothetical protein
MYYILIGNWWGTQSAIGKYYWNYDLLLPGVTIDTATSVVHRYKIKLESQYSKISVYQDDNLLFSWVDPNYLSNVLYYTFGSWDNTITFTDISALADVYCKNSDLIVQGRFNDPCPTNFCLQGTTCYNPSPTGTYNNEGPCEMCNSTRNCKTCSSFNFCTSCTLPLLLTAALGTCSTACIETLGQWETQCQAIVRIVLYRVRHA